MPFLIIAVMLLGAVLAISQHIDLAKRHTNASNSIVNYNATMQDFYYSVRKTKAEILQCLQAPPRYAVCKYQYEPATCSIIFSPKLPDGSLEITYRIYITEHPGYSIVRVIQYNYLWEKNPYFRLQNEFWKQLLDAEPVSYVQQPSTN